MAVLPGVDVRLAAARRAGDDVRHAVVVRVARGLDAGAELFAGCAVDFPEELAGLRRVDVDAAGVLPGAGPGRRGRDEVGDAVAVDVAEAARDPAELVVGRLAVPLAEHDDVLGSTKGCAKSSGFGSSAAKRGSVRERP